MYIYRPQTKFAKVMFLQVSVCPQGRSRSRGEGGGVCGMGACVAGGMCGRGDMHGGHARQGVCMAGGMCGRGACMARGACMVGRVCGRGACMPVYGTHAPPYYEIQSMSRRYASYWNAFLFHAKSTFVNFS